MQSIKDNDSAIQLVKLATTTEAMTAESTSHKVLALTKVFFSKLLAHHKVAAIMCLC